MPSTVLPWKPNVNWTYWTKNWPLNLISQGDDYTIADIAIWSWYGRLAQDKVWDRAGIFLDVKEYKHLQAWTEKLPIAQQCNEAWK